MLQWNPDEFARKPQSSALAPRGESTDGASSSLEVPQAHIFQADAGGCSALTPPASSSLCNGEHPAVAVPALSPPQHCTDPAGSSTVGMGRRREGARAPLPTGMQDGALCSILTRFSTHDNAVSQVSLRFPSEKAVYEETVLKPLFLASTCGPTGAF